MDFLRLRRHKRQRLAIAGEVRANDPMARLLLLFRNRDRLNDENDSRFHPYPICLHRDLSRPRVGIGSMIARLSAMKFAEFKKAGHWPTLLAALLYFDISFMAWVALGPLMVYIAHDMNLAVSEKFTLVAIPDLAGALLRVPMGILADIIGAKLTGIIAQLLVTAATARVWRFGLDSKLAIEIFGLALGIGGASFAVALPQASRW